MCGLLLRWYVRQSSEGEQGLKQTEWLLGEQVKPNLARDPSFLSPGLDIVPLVSTNGCTTFILCIKTILPNQTVNVSEIKEEDVSDEEVTGVQELPSELPAAELVEQNAEGTPDDAVLEDASSLVTSPYKWVVEAANYNEALDMIESVSSRPFFLWLT